MPIDSEGRNTAAAPLPAAPGRDHATNELRRLIADNAHACTFQSMGQYRSSLLKAIDAAGPAAQTSTAPGTDVHPVLTLPPLDDDLRTILGRPNFACIRLANDLRAVGFEIAHKAEAEQAAVLHYMLGFYLSHGTGWADACGDDMERRLAALSTTSGTAR